MGNLYTSFGFGYWIIFFSIPGSLSLEKKINNQKSEHKHNMDISDFISSGQFVCLFFSFDVVFFRCLSILEGYDGNQQHVKPMPSSRGCL